MKKELRTTFIVRSSLFYLTPSEQTPTDDEDRHREAYAKDHAEQQGGAQIASAISTIAGGAIIIAAAVYFGMLDTSWMPN